MAKLTNKEFIAKAKEVHGDKYDYSKTEYNGSHIKICIVCPEHGEFFQTAYSHLNGCGCPLCSKSKRWDTRGRKKTSDFIAQAKKIHGEKYDYSETEYKNRRDKVKIICHKKYKNGTEHGYFFQTPGLHLNGRGCPHCRNSRLETKINNFLREKKIVFEKEKTFEWLKNNGHLYLDYFLPEYNIAIECQGIQHFLPLVTKITNYDGEKKFKYIIKNDKIKKELCDLHNIKILYFTDKCIYEKFNNDFLICEINKLKKEINGCKT